MARYFKEQDIDEFRDCFYLKTTSSSGQITNIDELKTIMRSLGMSPTISELESYLSGKGGKLSFADFLDVMHTHSKKEKIPQEILDAFSGFDRRKSGLVTVSDLKHVLCDWGEKLDPRLVDKLFREANISGPHVKYHDFVKILCAPSPDY